MESLDHLEPFNDLEDWLDDVGLFMEAMCNPHHMADVHGQEAKLKKQNEEKSEPQSDDHREPEKNNPQLDRMGDPISGINRVATTKASQESSQSIFGKHWMEEPEGLTTIQSYCH